MPLGTNRALPAGVIPGSPWGNDSCNVSTRTEGTKRSLDCSLGLTHQRLSELLDKHQFDAFVESECEKFYAPSLGRPSLTPGIYFRGLLVGYFEGIDSERGVAWRLADSLSPRRFLAIELDEQAPDHSTISRTRRLIGIETCSPGRCGCWRARAYWRAERSASTEQWVGWKPRDKAREHRQAITRMLTLPDLLNRDRHLIRPPSANRHQKRYGIPARRLLRHPRVDLVQSREPRCQPRENHWRDKPSNPHRWRHKRLRQWIIRPGRRARGRLVRHCPESRAPYHDELAPARRPRLKR